MDTYQKISRIRIALRMLFATMSIVGAVGILGCRPKPAKSNVGKQEVGVKNPKPLNVVLITLDTVRADHLHCYGYTKIETPNIDALAAKGVLFEKALTQAPLTQPSHASMFTGTNPNINHVRNNAGFALQPSSVTMAYLLQKRGWSTAAFVSAAVLKKIFGLNQGFAVYDDQMPQISDTREMVSRPANITVDHAIQWLNGNSKETYFIWLHLFDAHQPYHPPREFLRQYPGRPYDAAIAFEDQQLGRFLQAVKEKSPESQTLIVLLSDHGQSLGEHGEFEHGIFLYDSTIHIPWIMAGPGIPAGLRIQQQAREIDLLPTVLELLGENPPSTVQGTSLIPAFYGKPVPTQFSYEETLCPKINMGWSELLGIHTDHWMYVRAPRPELYDLDNDPKELSNVIGQHPQEYRELAAQLKKLNPAESSGKEILAASEMDQNTMKQLESLGYVSNFSARNIELNGRGDDPKDHTATLKVLEEISNNHVSPAEEVQLLRTVMQSDSRNPTLFQWLIDAYQRAGLYTQAIQACQQALQAGIREGVLSRLASLYLRQGNIKEAISYYEQSAQLDPLDLEAQSNLGTAYLQTGRVTDAEKKFRWVLAIEPYAAAYNGLGLIADQRNDLKTAQKDFSTAASINPDYVEAQLNLGIVCTHLQDIPCARTAFRAFLSKATSANAEMIPKVKKVLEMMGQKAM